jgi:hypothetical protein
LSSYFTPSFSGSASYCSTVIRVRVVMQPALRAKYVTSRRSFHPNSAHGIRVTWNGDPLEPPVIPAKAGIQSDDSTFPKVCGVDSRPSASSGQAFRGNDCAPNDTSTRMLDSLHCAP